MKKIFSFFLTCILATLGFAVSAQSSQITTLMSGDDVKIYFGPRSFKEAVEAASEGDVITMSAGVFDSPGTISKPLTVRGAGMGLEDYKPYIAPTIINGNISLKSDFTGEGLRFINQVDCYGIDVTFTKCYIYKLLSQSTTISHCTLVQCYLSQYMLSYKWDLYAINSALTMNNENGNFNGIFLNCYVNYYSRMSGMDCIKNSTFTNCIIKNSNTTYRLQANSSTIYNNCMFFGKNGGNDFSNVMINGTCYGSNSIENVFKEEGFYELMDTYKGNKGNDGKEVGIYGGNLGFDITPTNPQITRFNVAPKTSVDGKLSIELEVKGAE